MMEILTPKEAETDDKIFKPGSILKRPLDGITGFFYCHVGIYIGKKKVIHFCGFKKGDRNAVIRKDSLSRFADGHPIKVHTQPVSDAHAKAVVREAKRLCGLDHNEFNKSYSFIFNNCEDFTTSCYEVEYYE